MSKDVKVFHSASFRYGQFRNAFLAKWRRKLLVYHSPVTQTESVKAIHWLQTLPIHRNIVQLVGHCSTDGSFLTEYHKTQTELNPQSLISLNRISLCLSFAEILNLLHSHPDGPIVMSNPNEDEDEIIEDILESLIVVGDEFPARVVIHDFRSLRWDMNDTLSGTKHDIKMAPQVCNVFLGDDKLLKDQLKTIHKMCREKNPMNRPPALHLMKGYKNVLENLILK